MATVKHCAQRDLMSSGPPWHYCGPLRFPCISYGSAEAHERYHPCSPTNNPHPCSRMRGPARVCSPLGPARLNLWDEAFCERWEPCGTGRLWEIQQFGPFEVRFPNPCCPWFTLPAHMSGETGESLLENAEGNGS